MPTPICDFVRKYAQSDAVRMHMPGHKGAPLLGCEPLDITEFDGADELYAPEGIIAESERIAGGIFGCTTLYSTEGSSLCIRAMLYLAMQHAAERGRRPLILAARNAHKTFVTAAVLLGFDILWIPPQKHESYLSCTVTPEQIAEICADTDVSPIALYITSPDYLGNVTDIAALSACCHAHDMLLIADNAHGAYLKFLPESQHPIDLGADLCCDSAHKTLPALTGAAYLHISDSAPEICRARAKTAMALFASTSPSYLILQSLDRCNEILLHGFRERLRDTVSLVDTLKSELKATGFMLKYSEPMKLTIGAKAYGYTGTALSDLLRLRGVICEFHDPDYLVLMPSPYSSPEDLRLTTDALCAVTQKDAITMTPPEMPAPEIICTPREAMLSAAVTLPLSECIGRVCAEITVSCPPAVPVVVCGERITEAAARCLRYYGVTSCAVLDKPFIQ